VTTWILVVLLIAASTTLLVIAFVVSLVREGILIGRTARQFQDEAQPEVDEITRLADRASTVAAGFQAPGRAQPS
jgi:hypothetical protein